MQRKTLQRTAIRQAITVSGRPLSPIEILESAQSEVPSLGIATVYRNLRSLLEEGWLQEVALPGQSSRYEVAGKDHHHHFHCRLCDRVFEIEACPGSIKELAPPGFRSEGHEIILYGVCRLCAA
ncbi:MAG TPA: transcriptional repressor [Thermoanaerobaculia bacterium]|nr:transcriptional repressor [Thermoanaerobaculia bacterium]